MIKSKFKLSPTENPVLISSKSKGFMSETDIDNYNIVDTEGNITGSAEHTSHMAVRGFKTTNSLVQRDNNGNIIHRTDW